ncbi:unnamed protein product [Amoebophrya sp. A120]|nr:unnamed protein product [Amoebophrya sp. A120]|eukprot:GSA120T00018939001.1
MGFFGSDKTERIKSKGRVAKQKGVAAGALPPGPNYPQYKNPDPQPPMWPSSSSSKRTSAPQSARSAPPEDSVISGGQQLQRQEPVFTQELIGLDTQLTGIDGNKQNRSVTVDDPGGRPGTESRSGPRSGFSRRGDRRADGNYCFCSWRCLLVSFLVIAIAFALLVLLVEYWQEEHSPTKQPRKKSSYRSDGSTIGLPHIFKSSGSAFGGNRPSLYHQTNAGEQRFQLWDQEEEQEPVASKPLKPVKPLLDGSLSLVPDYASLHPSPMDSVRARRFSILKSAQNFLEAIETNLASRIADASDSPAASASAVEQPTDAATTSSGSAAASSGAAAPPAAQLAAAALPALPTVIKSYVEKLYSRRLTVDVLDYGNGRSTDKAVPAHQSTSDQPISPLANLRITYSTSSTTTSKKLAPVGFLTLFPIGESLREAVDKLQRSSGGSSSSHSDDKHSAIPPELLHVALLVGLLEVFAAEKPALQSDVVVVFSPDSASRDVGVDRMLEDGLLSDLRSVLYLQGSGGHPVCGSTSALFWKLGVFGQLAGSGQPQQGINALELLTAALDRLQGTFYREMTQGTQVQDRRHGFEVSSTMKPTQISCDGGGDTIPGHCTAVGDVRLSPFVRPEEARRKLESAVALLNEHVDRLPARGPYSKYSLYGTADTAPLANKLGRLDFHWIFDRREADVYEGFVCNPRSAPHRGLIQATRELYGASHPHAIGGSIRYVRMLQEFGHDVQVIGFIETSSSSVIDNPEGLRVNFQVLTKYLSLLDVHQREEPYDKEVKVVVHQAST